MVLSESAEEFLGTGVDLYANNVKEIERELQKNKAFRDWYSLIDHMEDLGYYTHSMTNYCIDNNPPKESVCKREGPNKNIIICEPPKKKYGLEEYTFSNVDPEGFKECMEYWQIPLSKHRAELIKILSTKT